MSDFKPENDDNNMIKDYYELDIDGKENIFNMSMEMGRSCKDKYKKSAKKSIDVEQLIYNLNYFPK